jgi:hypothetical protein
VENGKFRKGCNAVLEFGTGTKQQNKKKKKKKNSGMPSGLYLQSSEPQK